MINITLLCVGKLKEAYYAAAALEYQKRLGAFCRLQTVEVPAARLPKKPSLAQIEDALVQEGKALLAKIPTGARVYALCIEGKSLTSPELSRELSARAAAGTGSFVFIIGGSDGLSEGVKARSDCLLSMSAMTFPHRLARIMLLEQLYRAFMIESGGKYHK